MLGPCLFALVLALPGPAGQRDAVGWIGQLGAESFEDRVAACKALESLGSPALPALRAAADTPDARVQVRVRALIESIGRQAEADRFRQPTLVRLDFADRPLGEVIATLNDRHDLGLELRLGPEVRGMMAFGGNPHKDRLKQLKDRKVTLEAAQPVPFWEAIDRVCQAGALRYGLTSGPASGSRQRSMVLMSDWTGRGPAVDAGPFRVQVTGLRSTFDRDFTLVSGANQPPAKLPSGGDLNIALAVLPEPDLVVHQSGAVILTEATDDQGRSLLPLPPNPTRLDHEQARHFTSASGSLSVSMPLVVPDPPGLVIRRLQGRIPVVVVARSVDPIVVPLQDPGAVGRLVATRDMTMVVDEVALAPAAPIAVKVTVRSTRDFPMAGAGSARGGPANHAAFDRDRFTERLELRDANGHRLKVSIDSQTRGADGQGFYDSYRLVVSPIVDDVPAGGQRSSTTPIPAELRYYGLIQTTTEIPFDFRDIPMP